MKVSISCLTIKHVFFRISCLFSCPRNSLITEHLIEKTAQPNLKVRPAGAFLGRSTAQAVPEHVAITYAPEDEADCTVRPLEVMLHRTSPESPLFWADM